MAIKPHYFVANRIWWPTWSNLRWILKRRVKCNVAAADKATTIDGIRSLVRKLYSHFDWTKDDWTELWDSVCPPAYNYQRYTKGTLKDDCDGFHALSYHCLYQSGITTIAILSVLQGTSGHAVLIFKLNGSWYVNDYDSVYGGYSSAGQAITEYNKIYIRNYCGGKGTVSYNSLLIWDYNKNKWFGENTSYLRNK